MKNSIFIYQSSPQRNEKNESGQLRVENDCGVYLTQKDIGEVQLAKASIAAGIRLLLKKRNNPEIPGRPPVTEIQCSVPLFRSHDAHSYLAMQS